MTTKAKSLGILSSDNRDDQQLVKQMLTKAYWMEMETVMSYMAASINPDGVRAQAIADSLVDEIQEELGHARQFGERIKTLYGIVPGSFEFKAEQSYLQPPETQSDVEAIIKGVIEAEAGAVAFYTEIIQATGEIDPVTQDMVISILRDEQRHMRLFEGFDREYSDPHHE